MPHMHAHHGGEEHGHGDERDGEEGAEEGSGDGRGERRPGALERLREWAAGLFHIVMPARGHEFDTRSTAYPQWARDLWPYVRKDIPKPEFSQLVAETRAFKRFLSWGKDSLAAEHLVKVSAVLKGKDEYVVDKYEEVTGIPIWRVVEDPTTAAELVQAIGAGEIELRIAAERTIPRDTKAELEARWKERLWERFEKNTASVVENLRENDIFHAESFLMEVVFSYDGLQPERREFIRTKYLERYGIDLDRMLDLKADERGQLKEFIRLVKEKREMDAMLDEMTKDPVGPA